MLIRRMKHEDIDFALSLTRSEGWSDIHSDFALLISSDPPSAFIAEEDSQRVAMISAVAYGQIGFIGSLIVKKEQRGKGLGTSLMLHAIECLENHGANDIMLDAVPEAAPIYEKLGFNRCCRSLRLQGVPKTNIHTARRLKDEDLERILALDIEAFSEDRSHFLKSRILEFPDLCYVIERDGEITGFAIGSDRQGTVRIAPWIVAEHDLKAGELVVAIGAARPNTSLSIGMLETNECAVETTLSLGFKEISSSIRMHKGENTPKFSDMMYAIGSPAKGWANCPALLGVSSLSHCGYIGEFDPSKSIRK